MIKYLYYIPMILLLPINILLGFIIIPIYNAIGYVVTRVNEGITDIGNYCHAKIHNEEFISCKQESLSPMQNIMQEYLKRK
jgi:hypothetical protein